MSFLSLQTAAESKVLVIYTGGTIGMLLGQRGYEPEPFYLTSTLRSQSRFHDPLGDSLFSNSNSAEGFREWSSNSGRASPSVTATNLSTAASSPTLLVRSSRPMAYPIDASGVGLPPANKASQSVYEMHVPSLITPRIGKDKRIRYAVLEWLPLLDSSDMGMNDWIRIAAEIELNYSAFDAFIVLHGSDTMCYSSSALSFLLEELGKTVIITGAQIPLSQLRNDAVENLLGALTIAGHYVIPECSLYFGHKLFRGNRVSKVSSFDLHAFDSPNFSPLVDVGTEIVVNWGAVLRQQSLLRFRAHKTMCPNVATLRLFPGITGATVRAFLAPPIQGMVLESFGSGNAPQRKDLIEALEEACRRGVIIVNISQCAKGSVSQSYATGKALADAGVIAGADMTPEAALTKLSYLLSKSELSPAEIRTLLRTPLRGELTPAAVSTTHSPPSANMVGDAMSHIQRLSSSSLHEAVSFVPDDKLKESSAAWSATAADSVSAQAALLPFLMHLAVSRDDVEAVHFCIEADNNSGQVSATPLTELPLTVASGIVNAPDAGSGRSPLHTAALCGSEGSVNLLLTSGALVHLRDSLGHTALYYAARNGNDKIVRTLVEAGANLGGVDISGGFVGLAVSQAMQLGDETSLQIWSLAGYSLSRATATRKADLSHAELQ